MTESSGRPSRSRAAFARVRVSSNVFFSERGTRAEARDYILDTKGCPKLSRIIPNIFGHGFHKFAIEGTGENGNLGQSTTPDALNVFKVSESKRVLDFAGGRQRLEQTRIATFGAPNPAPQKQNLGLDGDVAYNVAANGTAKRASTQTAKDRRMEMYHHPIGALRAALKQGTQLSNPRKEGNDDVVDIMTAQGDKFTLFVDSGTKLPSKVVSMTSGDTNWPLGDVTLETRYAPALCSPRSRN